ncbi:hypothetical protein [Planktotalea arctica]|uniref:hypothetical protein n=1 Tax=Planktotalea arctica TaxID=1481893 RepID=UPI00321B2A0D
MVPHQKEVQFVLNRHLICRNVISIVGNAVKNQKLFLIGKQLTSLHEPCLKRGLSAQIGAKLFPKRIQSGALLPTVQPKQLAHQGYPTGFRENQPR